MAGPCQVDREVHYTHSQVPDVPVQTVQSPDPDAPDTGGVYAEDAFETFERFERNPRFLSDAKDKLTLELTVVKFCTFVARQHSHDAIFYQKILQTDWQCDLSCFDARREKKRERASQKGRIKV